MRLNSGISPRVSTILNVALAILVALSTGVINTDAVFGADTAHVITNWAAFVVAVVNAGLHALSTSESGPLTRTDSENGGH
jgi:hypothetical protein